MKSWVQFSRSRLSIFLVAFIGIILFLVVQTVATPKNSTATLYLNPANVKIKAGQPVTLEIWMDARNQPVNAVQANLNYPTDKFGFSNINSTGSAFEIEAESSGGNGLIKIARGHIGSVSGVQLVAKVNLVAKSGKGNSSVNFASGSAIVRSTDNANVLGSTGGGNYKLGFLMNRNVFNGYNNK
jgi:hypothetical protein